MESIQEKLAELEDQFKLSLILESEYRDQKRELIRQLRDAGETISAEGSVQVAEVVDSRNVPFCLIPEGSFYFGPTDEDKEVKCPYYISKYPVTVREFKEFLNNVDIGYTDEDREMLSLVAPDDDCPASHLSYSDAKEFCRWLRRETGEYYSLPHEVEWERAARGEDGRFYPWGNEPPEHEDACFQGNMQYSCTIPVVTFGHRNRSPYGCVDMVGNVWEWCLDTFDDERDPHILRGGSWCNDVDYTNCVARTFSFPPTKRIDYGGMRVIYLPGDMLTNYREAYADRDPTAKVGLTVVSLKQQDATKTAPPSAKLKSLAQELDAAAQRASAVPVAESNFQTVDGAPALGQTDDALNDAMAAAISNAANLFLRKSSADSVVPNDMPKVPPPGATAKPPPGGLSRDLSGLSTVAGMAKKETAPRPPGVGGPKYKSIEELRQEREAAAAENDGQGLEFAEDDRIQIERAKPLELPPAATYAAVVVWFILLLAVIGALVYRFNQ